MNVSQRSEGDGRSQQESHLAALDFLRGAAALTVACGHFFIYGNIHIAAVEPIPVLAVEVFFVLSGFVLAPQILRCVAAMRFRLLWIFLVRRWMRTVPPYLVALLAMSALFGQIGTADFFRYVFYVQNLFKLSNTFDYYTIAWSLSVEEWFYLTFPALCVGAALMAAKRATDERARAVLVVSLCGALFVIACAALRLFAPSAEADIAGGIRRVVIFRLDTIAVGVLLYLASKGQIFRPGLWVPLFALTSVAVYFISTQTAEGVGARLIYPLAASIFGATALVAALSVNDRVSKSAARIGAWLARISYSLYLFHLIILASLAHTLAPLWIPLQFGIYITICLGFTSIFYSVVEAPILAARPSFDGTVKGPAKHRNDPGRFPSGRRDLLINVSLAATTICLCLVAGEFGFRAIDGYRFDQVALTLRVVHDDTGAGADTLSYAKQTHLDPTFRLDWYTTDPANYDRSPKRHLPADWVKAETNFQATPDEPGYLRDEFRYLYNYNFLVDACKTGDHSNFLKYYERFPGFVYAFAAPDSTTDPPFRIAPSGWDQGSDYYNNFGFRGPDLSARKPARVIRIAFLGSSTSANGWPFTYPEFVAHYLKLWARANDLNVDFDVINAGRGGVASTAIANIYRYEVAPLHPDIVIYYEGSNDLNTNPIVKLAGATSTIAYDKTALRPNIDLEYLPFERSSALLDRIYELFLRRGGAQSEPAKPPHTLTVDLKQRNIDLLSSELPFDLHRQLIDFRDMEQVSREIRAQFFLTSFVTLVHNGLKLDQERDRVILRNLNVSYWPLTYGEIRDAVDYQNAAYRQIASTDHDKFLDVDRYFPQDPALFADMVHFGTQSGYRLQGWIVAQLLAPYIRAAMARGDLPKPAFTPNSKQIAWATARPIKFSLSCLPP